MGTIATALKHMLAANMDAEAIVAAICEMEASVVDVQADRRREKDRIRKQQKRLRKSAESDDTADTVPPKEIPPTPPKEITPSDIPPATPKGVSAPTPRGELETVLDAVHAAAVLDHRQRLRKPLTAHAAGLLARRLAEFPDPNAAADTMIERGWQSIRPGWGDDGSGGQARAGPRTKPSPIDHFRNLASELNGQDRDDRGPSGHRDDAPGIPVRVIEHHGR